MSDVLHDKYLAKKQKEAFFKFFNLMMKIAWISWNKLTCFVNGTRNELPAHIQVIIEFREFE